MNTFQVVSQYKRATSFAACKICTRINWQHSKSPMRIVAQCTLETLVSMLLVCTLFYRIHNYFKWFERSYFFHLFLVMFVVFPLFHLEGFQFRFILGCDCLQEFLLLSGSCFLLQDNNQNKLYYFNWVPNKEKLTQLPLLFINLQYKFTSN